MASKLKWRPMEKIPIAKIIWLTNKGGERFKGYKNASGLIVRYRENWSGQVREVFVGPTSIEQPTGWTTISLPRRPKIPEARDE